MGLFENANGLKNDADESRKWLPFGAEVPHYCSNKMGQGSEPFEGPAWQCTFCLSGEGWRRVAAFNS